MSNSQPGKANDYGDRWRWCWWLKIGDNSRMLMTKMAKAVTNILKLSPTHFVPDTHYQHRCNRGDHVMNQFPMRSPWYFTVPSISLTVSNVAWLNFRGPPRCGGANQLSFVMDSQTYHDGMFSPWIPACDVLHSGKRWFSSFSLLDPSFSKRSASWTNFDLVVGDMYLKYWWPTLGLGLHRTTSFLAFFSIRNDQEIHYEGEGLAAANKTFPHLA